MEKEDIGGILGIIGLVIFLAYGCWWMAVGSDRSEYAFCKKEYMTNKGTANDANFSTMFEYCYDKTF